MPSQTEPEQPTPTNLNTAFLNRSITNNYGSYYKPYSITATISSTVFSSKQLDRILAGLYDYCMAAPVTQIDGRKLINDFKKLNINVSSMQIYNYNYRALFEYTDGR